MKRAHLTLILAILACLRTTVADAATVSGTVTASRTPGSPVPRARVMLFDPALTIFLETRTDASGAYRIEAPPGGYRLGVAAVDYEYREFAVTLSPVPLEQDSALDPGTHPGMWATIGDTSPESFGASNSGSLLADGSALFCHNTRDPVRFNPVSLIKTFPADSGDWQGCSALTLLGTGELLFVGGQQSPDFRDATSRVKTFSTSTGQWSTLPSMNQPRWYPALARLADGSLLVCGGGQAPGAQRTATCERWDPQTRLWSPTSPMSLPSEYSPMALLHTGEVLKTWFPPELYDPATGAWRATGATVQSRAGVYPDHCDHSMIVRRDGGALIVGVLPVPASPDPVMAEHYDPCPGIWRPGGDAVIARSRPEVVPLPDGRVFVAGGRLEQAAPGVFTNAEGYVRLADLYDPGTQTWRPAAEMRVAREYHATTFLIPDGRVLTTAGTGAVGLPSTDLGIDAYSPPYMFRGPRPRIDAISTTSFVQGQSFTLTVSFAERITSVVMLGAQATTHYVDGAIPRSLALPFTQIGSLLQVRAPSSPIAAPEGYYLLFVVVDDVPSPGRLVRLEPAPAPPPPDRIGDALRVDRAGDDLILDWRSGPLNPSRYNVYRSARAADLELTPSGIGIRAPLAATSEEAWSDPEASSTIEPITFYRILGRNCDGSGQIP